MTKAFSSLLFWSSFHEQKQKEVLKTSFGRRNGD